MPNENGSYNLMLDPSMLLDFEAWERIRAGLGSLREEGAEIFLASGFVEFLAAYNQGHIEPGAVEEFVRFYEGEQLGAPNQLYNMVQALLAEELISLYSAREDDAALLHSFIREYLYRDLSEDSGRDIREYYEGSYYHLPETLFDEWVFLQEASWILSKIRRTFDQMVHAGGVGLQWGKRHLDIVVRKTRRKDAQEALTRIDRLITLGKWVGIGGLAAIEAGFISPPAGALFTVHVAYPAFVMIDP